ncbi:hypothetical protein E2C01_021299 [Portunus trituberculatus]|uniref:Uncharacterized protein n=1 Tax=Portunus trituberculatus TaxID=210409 RepID=A0A5B7E5Q3_PORTR|nr:hypothetical protein [Portunus trituberculatus]
MVKAAVVQWNHAWGPRGLQAHGFESCPRSECRLGFLTRGNGFLAGEHVQPHKTDAHHGKKAQARRPAAPANPAQGQHEIKKDLHLQHITEHNIEKKHDDKVKTATYMCHSVMF